jgi:hypothetical protein
MAGQSQKVWILEEVTNGRALNAAIGTDGMPLVNLFTNDCHLVLSIGNQFYRPTTVKL